MKKPDHRLAAGLLGLVAATTPGAARAQTAGAPPNIIVIQGEGHGWASLPFALDGSGDGPRTRGVAMPSFERLAREGVRFSRFYAPSPRCTPTRAALLTGKTPAQLDMTFVSEGRRDAAAANTKLIAPRTRTELPEAEVTIAELLKDRGYATAHFGKWHVGRTSPSRHGFDEHDGANSNGGPDNSQDPAAEQTPITGRKSVEFIGTSIAAGKPFYLQLDQYASKQSSAQEALDSVLGDVLKTLEERKALGNTWILYTTDHGDPGRNLPLRGGKGFLTEGGIRVPFLALGPGVAKGKVVGTPAGGVDLFATIAEMAGVKQLPARVEGGSLLSLLRGGSGVVRRPREALFFHFPHYDFDNGGPASAIVLGDWKLVRRYETATDALYDLSKDPGERTDHASMEPASGKDLAARLDGWLKETGAKFATKNETYDPSKPYETNLRPGGEGRGGGGGFCGGGGRRGEGGGGRGGRGGRGGAETAPTEVDNEPVADGGARPRVDRCGRRGTARPRSARTGRTASRLPHRSSRPCRGRRGGKTHGKRRRRLGAQRLRPHGTDRVWTFTGQIGPPYRRSKVRQGHGRVRSDRGIRPRHHGPLEMGRRRDRDAAAQLHH
ncbi:MAG: sulfatase-like hydrolase/transferase, partial [Armatimonadota bacterium]